MRKGKYPDINPFYKEFDPGNILKFWKIESYGVLEKQKPNILPQMEQHALNILEKNTANTNNLSICKFQSMKSPMELSSLLSIKILLLYHLVVIPAD